MNILPSKRLAVMAVAAVAALAGCDRNDDRTVGQQIDSAIGRSAQAGRDVREGGREAADDTRTAVMGAASGTREAAANLGRKIDDAGITGKVKTGLAADKDIAAGKVDVDTRDGVVTLSGSVASEEARRRAAEIASHVKDVRSVNNQLAVTKAG